MIFEDQLLERKGLKHGRRVGLTRIQSHSSSLVHHLDQSNKVISSDYQEWLFGERSLCPFVGMPPFVG